MPCPATRTIVIAGSGPGVLPLVATTIASAEIPKHLHRSCSRRRETAVAKATAARLSGDDPALEPRLLRISGKRLIGDEVQIAFDRQPQHSTKRGELCERYVAELRRT